VCAGVRVWGCGWVDRGGWVWVYVRVRVGGCGWCKASVTFGLDDRRRRPDRPCGPCGKPPFCAIRVSPRADPKLASTEAGAPLDSMDQAAEAGSQELVEPLIPCIQHTAVITLPTVSTSDPEPLGG
jgi:hypothetical protein